MKCLVQPGSGGDQATRKAIGEQLAQTGRDAAVPPGTDIDQLEDARLCRQTVS
jgi:hypothetical protein